jgi:AhpD family alkylhydroperoxidase
VLRGLLADPVCPLLGRPVSPVSNSLTSGHGDEIGDGRFLPHFFWQRLALLATVSIEFPENPMSTFGLIEYAHASPEVRAIYDDIMATRKTDWINNFWKAIAHDPATLKRTWESIKHIMAPGALDPLTKELIYIAVSVTNNCHYCIASHTASAFKKGMTDAMFRELQAVIGMANETNKLVTGYQVEMDEQFRPPLHP